jgi:hypothetical protein
MFTIQVLEWLFTLVSNRGAEGLLLTAGREKKRDNVQYW